MAKQTVCNWCGKTMSAGDEYGGISLHKRMGYGTIFDGANIDLDLCPLCAEEFIELNEKRCSWSMLSKGYACL